MSAQHQQNQYSAKAQGIFNHPMVQQARNAGLNQLGGLDKQLSQFGFANSFEQKTQIPKSISFLVLFGLFVTLLFFNVLGLASPISTIVGFALPALLSLEALESPGDADDKQWLTYWIVFGAMNVVESMFLRLVMYYIPFYFVFKTCLIVWLQLPGTKGATVLYNSIIRPYFQPYLRQFRRNASKVNVPGFNSNTNTNTAGFNNTNNFNSPPTTAM